MTREKERFVSRDPGRVAIYSCGVTPYDESHLGHARPAIFFDVVRRYLTRRGWQVRYVQNFTDVDDKIIARANQRGEPPLELAARYADDYLSVMDVLGVHRADAYPKVSEHIELIVQMVSRLVEKGHAYVASNGDVYFAVETFPQYGKLSHQRLEDVMAGARVEVGETKRNPADFAVWKAAKPGEPSWPSPWGPGRPGWHIECSAMSLHYLGNHFDIHGGGVDLVFPHHENEIAQSEAFTGEPPFARHWLHNGLITTRSEKMSKSLGNFTTIRALLGQYPAPFLRFFLLSVHYRTPLEFSPETIANAWRGWQRLLLAWQQVYAREQAVRSRVGAAGLGADAGRQPGGGSAGDEGRAGNDHPLSPLEQAVAASRTSFDEAMQDDFNTAVAISSLFELARQVNSQAAADPPVDDPGVARGWLAAATAFRDLGVDILGVLPDDPNRALQSASPAAAAAAGSGNETAPGGVTPANWSALVELILELRQRARARKDWTEADEIRRRLGEVGIVVEDTPQGSRWRWQPKGV
ncbi:MAG: cysteine--tRNA ligase [Limnochordaceae bacterium]|nr:cysteine--tRNA ligase [Limnochordaceae bacterium]